MFTKSYFSYILNIVIIIAFNMQFTSAKTICGKDICLGNNTVFVHSKTSESLGCICLEGYFKVSDDKGIRCEKKANAASGTDKNPLKSRTRSPETADNDASNKLISHDAEISDSNEQKVMNKNNEFHSDVNAANGNDIKLEEETAVTKVKSNNPTKDTTVDLKESTTETILPKLNDDKDIELRVSYWILIRLALKNPQTIL